MYYGQGFNVVRTVWNWMVRICMKWSETESRKLKKRKKKVPQQTPCLTPPFQLTYLARLQSSWGQHGAHLGPVGPRSIFDGDINGNSTGIWYDFISRTGNCDNLQWHNKRDGASNHWRLDCLFNRLFRCIGRSKKTSKLRVTGPCEENSKRTGEFPAQRANNAENVSIWWRHHMWYCPRTIFKLDEGTFNLMDILAH